MCFIDKTLFFMNGWPGIKLDIALRSHGEGFYPGWQHEIIQALLVRDECMARFATTLSCILALGLAGCATPKPKMTDEGYKGVATGTILSEKCAIAGFLDFDTAAAGSLMVRQKAALYDYDPVRLKTATDEVARILEEKKAVNQEVCNTFGYKIAQEKQIQARAQAEEDRQSAAMAAAAQGLKQTLPKTTYCNKIGTQVFCNSY